MPYIESVICCYFVGSFLVITLIATTVMAMFAAAILYGAGFGWTFFCLNTTVGHFFGPIAFPKVNGMLMLLSALLCSPAGIIGGKIFDAFKSYQMAFELNMILCVVGIIAMVFATMPQMKEASSEKSLKV